MNALQSEITKAVKAAVEPLAKKIDRLELMLTEKPKDWLTIKEAASQAAVCEATIRRRIKQGAIESKGAGRGLRVWRKSL